MPSDRTIVFGAFRLDHAARRLLRGDEPLALRPKAFEVLACLAERQGRLVTKRELMDAVWPETFVSDSVLKVCIREIREALGDDPRRPRYIETAHRQGYRFVAACRGGQLPVPLTSFVGRRTETGEVRGLVERHRLTTLTGPGGVGKTRLALEAVGAARDAWWVELAPIVDPARVPEAIAAALAIDDRHGRPVVESLLRALRDREGVLVLDNCEHVIRAAAETARLLVEGCPRLRVLATSREALGLPGEVTWTVPPLSSADGISLFLARSPEDPSPPPRVARLCESLDGLPLAIELAAARARVLGLEEVAARLGHPLHVLTSGSKGEGARHETMRATIDWSYGLLGEDERRLFERLSVFAGGFGLEDVEHVCGGAPLRGDAVAGLLAQLIDKSLVVSWRADPGRPARHRLLELVRAYAAERLEEPSPVRARHLSRFLAVADDLAADINTAAREACLARLDLDHANFLAAIDHAKHGREPASAQRLAGALAWYWFHRGRWREGRRVLAELVAPATGADAASRARALFADGLLAWTTGDHAGARERLEDSVRCWRETSDAAGLGHALQFLAVELLGSDEVHEATRLVREGVAAFRTQGDPFGLATALASAGIVALSRNDLHEARALFEESVAVSGRIPDPWALALALRNLGVVALRQGELDTALERLRESLRSLQSWPERWFVSRSLETIAFVYARREEHVRAAELLGAGESLRDGLGAGLLPFYRADYDRALAVLRSALDARTLDQAWSRGRAMTAEQAMARALAG